jgi:hypothetical protein
VCRYVMVRFHSALEHYIWTRCKPFLRVEDTPIDQLPGKQRRKFKNDFQGTSYPKLQSELEKSYPLLAPIPQKTALLAQGFRLVRNEFIHKEEDWTPPWSDSAFQARVESSFHGADRKTILSGICESVHSATQKDPTTPPLFFYALYSLTSYRNLAKAIEYGLPLDPSKPNECPA